MISIKQALSLITKKYENYLPLGPYGTQEDINEQWQKWEMFIGHTVKNADPSDVVTFVDIWINPPDISGYESRARAGFPSALDSWITAWILLRFDDIDQEVTKRIQNPIHWRCVLKYVADSGYLVCQKWIDAIKQQSNILGIPLSQEQNELVEAGIATIQQQVSLGRYEESIQDEINNLLGT